MIEQVGERDREKTIEYSLNKNQTITKNKEWNHLNNMSRYHLLRSIYVIDVTFNHIYIIVNDDKEIYLLLDNR